MSAGRCENCGDGWPADEACPCGCPMKVCGLCARSILKNLDRAPAVLPAPEEKP